MSNENDDLKLFNYLTSAVFLNDIKTIECVQSYNVLLGLHMLAIGFSTTGISSGGFTIKYSQNIAPETEDFFRAKFSFYFYNTKNGLIEDSLQCSNAYRKYSNHLFMAKYGRQFKDEMLENFLKHSKNIEDLNYFKFNELLITEQTKFSLLGKKRVTEEAKIQFIKQVTNNLGVKKLLSYQSLHFFLDEKNESKQIKFKL